MSKDDAIRNLPTFHISRLLRRNEKWEQRFESGSNDFGDNLVDYVAQGDRSIFVRGTGLRFLGNKDDECGIHGWKHPPYSSRFLNYLLDVHFHQLPESVEKI